MGTPGWEYISVQGSDMPNVLRFCTYAQSYRYLHKAPFLNSEDLALIEGGNLLRLFRLDHPPPGSVQRAKGVATGGELCWT